MIPDDATKTSDAATDQPKHDPLRDSFEIARRIRGLSDVRLLRLNASSVMDQAEPQVNFRMTAGCSQCLLSGPDTVVVTAEFKCNAFAASENANIPASDVQAGEPVVTVEASFRLVYKIEQAEATIEPKHLKAFGKINGVFNAWPYWRELLQNTTARMGLPALIAPPLPPREK